MPEWSDLTIKELKNIKRDILLKGFLMSFLIDENEFWDKVFKRTHTAMAGLAPIVGIIAMSMNSAAAGVINITAGGIAAGMLKLKNYLTSGKIRALAKEQILRYDALYETIKKEEVEDIKDRQEGPDFIYWLKREYKQIALQDPEISHSDKKKFAEHCKSKNIPYKTELMVLQDLLKETQTSSTVVNDTVIVVQKKPDNPPPPLTSDFAEFKRKRESISTDTKPEIVSKSDRDVHKKNIQNINTAERTKWAMDRMAQLD